MKKTGKVMGILLTVILAAACLVSCGLPATPEKAVENLEGNGYTAANMFGKAVTGFKVKDGKGEIVMLMFADSSDDAKKAYDQFKDDLDSVKESLQALAGTAGIDLEGVDLKVERDGKVVALGTKAGIKAAK